MAYKQNLTTVMLRHHHLCQIPQQFVQWGGKWGGRIHCIKKLKKYVLKKALYTSQFFLCNIFYLLLLELRKVELKEDKNGRQNEINGQVNLNANVVSHQNRDGGEQASLQFPGSWLTAAPHCLEPLTQAHQSYTFPPHAVNV
ncbi:hypothetical protein I79_007321 [Cricetulus griseus]|uniref:Uncharacterized protein n=1 Tax=Cricetulus griseus TaxID=10029 RepID=G3HA79_CRIGR|nr:hypothetical protein I79_007321 [Cricetulus griseus]